MVLFICFYSFFVFFSPNILGHFDNYIEANPLVTPTHIVPEWVRWEDQLDWISVWLRGETLSERNEVYFYIKHSWIFNPCAEATKSTIVY